MPTLSDRQLLENHAAGDRSAIETLILRHIHMVYSTACRLVSPTEADDVTQTVFLLLTQKAHTISPRESLAPWLHRATRLCAANLRKREARHRRHLQEAAMHLAHTAADRSHHPGTQTQWLELLDLALSRLKEPERAVLLIHHLQQQSLENTALQLGITHEAARKRAARGLEKLRAYFARHNIPAASAIPALFATQTIHAPTAIIQSTLTIAHGAPAAAHLLTLAKATTFSLSTTPKIAAAAAIAASVVIATTFATIARTYAPPKPVLVVSLAVAPAAAPSTLPVPTSPSLPRLKLTTAIPGNPTNAEVRAFLKARLQRFSNILISYDVHTEYLPPPGGWPSFTRPPIDNPEPPVGFIAGPASLLAATAADLRANGPYLFIYPTGTIDFEKSFSILDGKTRYDQKITHIDRLVPYPASFREYYSQTYITHENIVERLFFDREQQLVVASTLNATLPEPDIEIALGLAGYITSFAYPSTGRAFTSITPDDIDAMTISFPDPSHILVTRQVPIPTGRGARRGSTAPPPSSISRGATRPASPAQISRDQWTFDRNSGLALVAYRHNADFEMDMSDFHEIGGLMTPQKISSRFLISSSPTLTTSQPASTIIVSPPQVWREDNFTIKDTQIQGPANTQNRYIMAWPGGQSPDLDPRVRTGYFENHIGAESFDASSFLHPFEETPISASAPASRDIDRWITAHNANLARAKQGHIDLLFLGGSYAAYWSKDETLWKKYYDAPTTANFSIGGDTIANMLWRINHGEIDGISPKVIILMPGPAYVGHGDGVVTTIRPSGVLVNTWLDPGKTQPTTAEVIDAVNLLIRQLTEKLPQSKILVMGLPAHPTDPGSSNNSSDRQRLAINDALSTQDDGKNIRYFDLSPATLEPDGSLSPDLLTNSLPTPELYERWSKAIAPLLKEMLSDPPLPK